MAMKLIEIPIIEDIYDFDSITLREATERVQSTKIYVEKLETKEQQHLMWLKKAKRYLELALNEIEERKAVENFGNFCIDKGDEQQDNNTKNYLAQTNSHGQRSEKGNSQGAGKKKIKNSQQQQPKQEHQRTNQPYGNVDEWVRLHELLSQTTPSASEKENTSQVSTTLNPVEINAQQYGVAERIEEEEEELSDCEKNDEIRQSSEVHSRIHDQFGSQKDISCNESVVSGMSYGSSRSSRLKQLNHHKRLKNKNKQELMLEFIKQTLEKTRITSNEMATPFYASTSGRSNLSEDDGISLQKKKKKKKSLDSDGLHKASAVTASLDRRMQSEQYSNNEYANVQSRIKQDLEQQRLKKLENTYFTTGKASYPKYKPPAEKKIDPEEERKKKTKNFLKKSTASVILPPLLAKPQLPQKIDPDCPKSGNATINYSEGGLQYSQNAESLLEVKGNQRYNKNNVIAPNKIFLQPLELGKRNEQVQTGRSRISHRSATGQGEIGEVSQEDESDGEMGMEWSKQTTTRKSISENSKTLKNAKESNVKPSCFDNKQPRSTRSTNERDQGQRDNLVGLGAEEILKTFQDEQQLDNEKQVFQERDYFLEDNNNANEDTDAKGISRNHTGNNSQQRRKEEEEKGDRSRSEQLIQRESKLEDKDEEECKQIEKGLNRQGENRINKKNGDYSSKITGQQGTDRQGVSEKDRLTDQTRRSVDSNLEIMQFSENAVQRSKRMNDESEDKGEDIIKSTNNGLNWQEREKDENPNDFNDDDDELVNVCENNNSYQNEFLVDQKSKTTEPVGNRQNVLPSMKGTAESKISSIDKGGSEKENTDERSRSPFCSRGYITGQTDTIGREQKELDSQNTNLLRQKMGNLKTGEGSFENEDRNHNTEDEKERQTEDDERKIEIENRPATERNEDTPIETTNNRPSKDLKQTTTIATEKHIRPSIIVGSVSSSLNSNAATSGDVLPSSQLVTRTAGPSSVDRKCNSNQGDKPKEDAKSKNNKETINSSMNQMDPLKSQSQDVKKNKKILGIKQSASAQAQQQAASQQNKLLNKMIKELGEDSNLIDYSSQIPSFQHLFSGFYNAIWTANNPTMGGNLASVNVNSTFSLLDHMRAIYQLFSQHVEKVDNVDKALLRYKAVVTPLEVLPSEVYYINDPTKVAVYSNRVDIDIRKFIERQIVFTQRMNGENFAGHLLPHEEFYFRVVKSKPEVYDIISRSFMRKKDWFELPHGQQLGASWNLLWTWSKPQIDFNKLLLFQKVNHFPFNKNLVRKDLLKKNFERITKLGSKAAQAFNILPVTFVLPKEYCELSDRFYEDTLKEGENNIWIIKPVGKSQGRGISLVNDISQVMYAEPVVVQKYMKNPLLLDGYKFDMRIYALVTHMKPLEVFVYKEGFARLSTEKYALNPENIKNNQIHLTNFSIQKHHYDYAAGANFIGGTKISLKMLQEKLTTKGISWEKIWTQVQEIIVKSLLACQTDIPNNPNCFEIFGYDIIIDSSLKCVLLEINSSPSLARDFIIDDLIKQQMVDDAIDLIKPVQFDRQRLLEVFDRRIREEQGNKTNLNYANNSKLQLNRDLNYILRGQKIRNFGEIPAFLGHWQPIAPTPMSEKYYKLIQSYKLPTTGKQSTASAANNNNTID